MLVRTRDSRSVAAPAGLSGSSRRSSAAPNPAKRCAIEYAASGHGRSAATRPIGSEESLRARKARTSRESWSAQCRSSTTTRTGESSRRSRSRSIRWCGAAGSTARPSGPPASSSALIPSVPTTWARSPNGSAASISSPRPVALTRSRPARAATHSSTDVLPRPASPTTNNEPAVPDRTSSAKAPARANNSSRSSMPVAPTPHLPPPAAVGQSTSLAPDEPQQSRSSTPSTLKNHGFP